MSTSWCFCIVTWFLLQKSRDDDVTPRYKTLSEQTMTSQSSTLPASFAAVACDDDDNDDDDDVSWDKNAAQHASNRRWLRHNVPV